MRGESEGEDGGREEVDGDQPLSPEPAVIHVGLNGGPSLRPVVEVAQFHGAEVVHPIHLPHPLHQELAEGREARERTHLHLTSLEVHLRPIILSRGEYFCLTEHKNSIFCILLQRVTC